MKAISKKLLSLLVVIAMVLSMVPFGGLSIFAVETKAAETASQSVTPGQANLPEGISTTNPVDNSDAAIDAHIAAGTCPMCNATGITWEKKENNINNPSTDVHYYYEPNTAEGSDGVYTFATNIIAQHSNANTTICVAVKSGTTLKTTNLRGVMMGSTGETLNIMGTGAFHVDTVSAGKTDYGVMQLGGGSAAAPNVVNLYGCTFTHETNQEDTSDWVAILRIQAATVTVNMYDGVVIGPETADTTQWSHNVRIDGGTLNMFGGTIQNGVSNKKGISGNVTVANSGTFNMYGGEVTGGNHLTTVTDNLGGNVLVGGYKQAASAFSAATFNMYGGSITAGKAKYGGGVYSPYSSAKVTISGGTIGGANAEDINEATEGGGIYAVGDSNVVTIQGTALLEGNSATSYGGNIHLNAATLTMEGGTVSGGYAASQGGNISGGSNSQINISGGSVYGGSFDPTGSGWGGNIRAYNTAVTISGGYIYDGCVKDATSNQNAGNIGALGSSTLTISGGNIGGDIAYVNGSLTLSGAPKIKYSGLQLEDGTTAPNAEYVGLPVYSASAIDISGLTADAEIQVTGSIGITFTASNANAADVVGCFSSTATTQEVALTDDNMQLKIIEKVAEPEVDVFDPESFDGEAYCPVCKEFTTWTVYDGTNNNDSTALGGTTQHYHLYLDKDWTYSADSFLWTYRKVCFNLNGHDVTAVAGASSAFGASSTSTINLMDTEGGAVVTGYRKDYTAGAALQVAGANAGSTINIYGGTYTKLDSDTTAPIVQIGGNGGTINMYGGTIDATGKTIATSTMTGCAVTVAGGGEGKDATFNMEGGEIKGGNAIQGGAVMVGRYSTTVFDTATFNLKGGKISGGTVSDILNTDGSVKTAGAGGNFSVQYGGTLNISGGTLCNGTVTGNTSGSSWGGNIRAYNGNVNISGGLIYGGTGGKNITGANVSVFSDATGRAAGRGKLTISGGTIVGDVAVSSSIGSGFLTLSGAPKIVTSMEIEGDTVNAVNGGLFVSGYTADISGLSAEADIAVTAALNVVLTDAHENAANVAGCFKPTNAAYTVEKQADNTLKVVEAVVAAPELDVFDPWNFDGMAYCPVCYANGTHTEPVEWIAITASTAAFTMAQGGHYYLSEDITNASVNGNAAYIQACGGSKICCLNLNGKDLTVTDGRALFGASSTFNVMDTEGGAVVSGNLSSAGNACTLLLNSAKAASTVNLYGGTFTKPTTNTTSSIVSIQANGGTINMYDGAVIDGTGCTTTNYATGVYLVGGITDYEGVTNSQYYGPAVFNMYGGEIKNGSTTKNGGNILVGDYSGYAYRKNTATFNMYGGTISGGTVAVDDNNLGGGNICLMNGGVMNMSGGTVKDGVAGIDPATAKKTNAGNILVNADSVLNMSGDAKVINGTAGNQAGNIRVWKGDLNMSGNAEISGGTSYGGSLNVWLVCSDMTMTDNAKVYGSGTANGNAINVSAYGSSASSTIISTLTLSGNATVKNREGTSNNSINLSWTLNSNADAADDACGKLMIDNGWTGEAYFYAQENQGVAEGATKTTLATYTRGATVDNAQAVCGELQEDGSFVQGGTFTGKLYYGPQNNTGIVGVNGVLYLAGYAVVDTTNDDATVWYGSMEEAVAAAAADKDNKYLLAGANVTVPAGSTVYIDALDGETITVEGAGTAYGIDIANGEDYANASTGKFSGNVESDATFNEVRYIKIADGSVHAIEMGITGVSLRPTAVGLYYKATYKCDADLAEAIDAYGVVLSVEDMPGADFADVATDQFTVREDFSDLYAANTVTANSGSVFGIMKDGKPNNQERGEMKIYANAYILVDGAAIYVGDTENAGQKAGVALSLYDVLKKIDDQVTAGKLELTQTNIEQITALYEKIKAWGVNWTFTNIQ